MANEYLRRTPTSTGNQRVFTISVWIKRGASGTYGIFGAGDGASGANSDHLWLNGDALSFSAQDGTNFMTSTPLLRDVGSWSHYHYIHKTDDAVAADRGQFFVNGVRLRDASSTTFSINQVISWMNKAGAGHAIGARNRSTFQSFMNGEMCDMFLVDGQALTPDVFGFNKQGKGYISVGSTQATDFRPGQWVPKTPRVIKTEINRRGGFGVNGFYLPMNDSRNFGADFHGEPNSIITLNEKLPQPRVGVASTAAVGLGFTDVLRADPYAANLVLALPFVSGGTESGFGDYSHIIRGSGSAKSITNTGVSIASTASYYGSGSYFDSGNYLSTPNVSDFQFGTGDFTMEAWTYSFSGSWSIVAAQGTTGDAGRTVFAISNTGQVVSQIGSQSLISSAGIATSAQWNHIAFVRKNGVGTIYLNGVSVGINTVYTNSIQNTTLYVGSDQGWTNTSSKMYIQDLRVYKSVAKYTGGFDVPRPYTPVGIATWRQVPDTTANNFATLNKLFNSASGNVVLADGNLTYTGSQTPSYGLSQSTIGVSTSKWYWEFRIGSTGPSLGVGVIRPGISTSAYPGYTPETSFVSGVDGGIGFYHNIANTIYYWDGLSPTYPTTVSYTLPACTTGDIVSIALDLTGGNNSKIYFAKNGTWGASGDPATGTNPVGLALSGTYLPAVSIGGAGASTGSINFGQNSTFSGNTTAGTFTDTNGKGLFKYQPPSGFLALCEDNLPTPVISDPGKYFKTVLYTGDGASGRSIVGVGFTPDLVWIKSRTVGRDHRLQDSVRGFTNVLSSDLTSAEYGTGDVSSTNNDGFSLLARDNQNVSGENYVAWCWRAGAGTTSTNTNGSITSVVSVNQDAGFSIVSYPGNGTDPSTIGHGLGKAPGLIIVKGRDNAFNWAIYHKSTTASNFLYLNSTSAAFASSAMWNTNPTSSVFSVGNQTQNNSSTIRYIAYCWAEIEGFSKFGSFVGNGSADGPFCWTGFTPAFVLIKRATGGAGNWAIFDNSRDSTNPVFGYLVAESSAVEERGTAVIDFTSNGFKIRNSWTTINSSGDTIIFAAFAQSPFAYSNSK
jgi:hypothetical protein